jgi:hypothetical protein
MSSLPSSIRITRTWFATDGGSLCVEFEGEGGDRHLLHLPQHRLPGNFRAEAPPGALILDERVLPPRSEEEAELMVLCRPLQPQSRSVSRPGASFSATTSRSASRRARRDRRSRCEEPLSES